jgi:5-methylcytosine-specific restriction endonuclease McrA
MAKNTNNRIAVKWVRDKAKAAYEKKDTCYICGTQEDLELHHLHSITLLLNGWAKKQGYDISSDDGILAVRDEFIEAHHQEIYEMVYTLCNRHHVALHSVYGKAPQPGSEPKQAHWINRQKQKYENPTEETIRETSSYGSFFSGLY